LKDKKPQKNWLNKTVQWKLIVKAMAEELHRSSGYTLNGNKKLNKHMKKFKIKHGLIK